MLQSILQDLDGVIKTREITNDRPARIIKHAEELGELGMAFDCGSQSEIEDELADCIIVAMVTAQLEGYNPFALVVAKLDKMQKETPFRGDAVGWWP